MNCHKGARRRRRRRRRSRTFNVEKSFKV